MLEIFDRKEIQKEGKKRFIINLVMISLLICLTIGGITILLLTSTLDYFVNMIVSIILGSLVVTFVIFYFINIFPIVRHYFSYYKNMNETAYERYNGLTFVEEKDIKTIDRVKYRNLSFSYKERQQIYYQNLYVLDNDVTFNKGDILKVLAYKNVIVKYEVIHHASVQ